MKNQQKHRALKGTSCGDVWGRLLMPGKKSLSAFCLLGGDKRIGKKKAGANDS